MPRKLTQEEFIAKAQAVHGLGRYDYSRVSYDGDRTKVAISCPEHGEFEQTPNAHMQGKGCKSCALEYSGRLKRELAASQFVAQAQARHGNRYDYSRVVYAGKDSSVIIICTKHGPFQQRASNHIHAGRGCPRCAGRRVFSLDEFINIATALHGEKYTYASGAWLGTQKKRGIVCPFHGAFEQTPNKHLAGQGCPACKPHALSIRFAHTTAHFIEKARAVHGERYDYSQAVYKRKSDKVTILCSTHGPFEQQANSHIQGCGCMACAIKERGRLTWVEQANGREGTLYFIRLHSDCEQFYKIGVTYLSVAKRYSAYPHLPLGFSYEVLALHTSTNAAAVYDWEQSILETFAHLKYTPKQPFAGASECFSSCEEILAIFPL